MFGKSQLQRVITHASNFQLSSRLMKTVAPQSTKSWQAKSDDEVQRVTITAMIHELTIAQTSTIAKTVPWFLKSMPADYFR